MRISEFIKQYDLKIEKCKEHAFKVIEEYWASKPKELLERSAKTGLFPKDNPFVRDYELITGKKLKTLDDF